MSVAPGSLKWPLKSAALQVVADFDNQMVRRLQPEAATAYQSHMAGGLAILAEPGQPVLAMLAGTVSDVAFEPNGFGNVVTIDHGNGVRTLYAHLSRASVRPGQAVAVSTAVGYAGNTGLSFFPHVCVGLRVVHEQPGIASKWLPYATLNPLGFLEGVRRLPPLPRLSCFQGSLYGTGTFHSRGKQYAWDFGVLLASIARTTPNKSLELTPEPPLARSAELG